MVPLFPWAPQSLEHLIMLLTVLGNHCLLLHLPSLFCFSSIVQMFTDCLFLIPHDWTTQLMSSTGMVFTYELHHRGEHGFSNQFLNAGLDLPQARNCKSPFFSHRFTVAHLFIITLWHELFQTSSHDMIQIHSSFSPLPSASCS